MNQDWFEMKDIWNRKLTAATWIPLRMFCTLSKIGKYGELNHKEDFSSSVSLAIPLDMKTALRRDLDSMFFGLQQPHTVSIQNGTYLPAGHIAFDNGLGEPLVLEQALNTAEINQWHLHQDFVIALGLMREGDSWVSVNEGYAVVAKLIRSEEGKPVCLRVRAEYLRDYLCARQMTLFVKTFRSRREIVEEATHITWSPPERVVVEEDSLLWEGRISAIHQGGMPFGSSTAVLHVGQTNIDYEEDVPSIKPTRAATDIETESWTITHGGKKLYVISGELERTEWIDPGESSPRVRGDTTPATIFFITDASEKRESKETLLNGGRWLWFSPNVVMTLSHPRGGHLEWSSRDTGAVGASPNGVVHFGMNELGFINVFARDIAKLSDWEQRIWSGFSVPPNGLVCKELLAIQKGGHPADTQAPEVLLLNSISVLNEISTSKLGFKLLPPHPETQNIQRHAHRFRAISREGFHALAKDLARLTADSISTVELRRYLKTPKDQKLGSLKLMETLVAKKLGSVQAHVLMGPLFGVYDLRLADAHLPTSQIDESLNLVGVAISDPYILQAKQMIDSCATTLQIIAKTLC